MLPQTLGSSKATHTFPLILILFVAVATYARGFDAHFDELVPDNSEIRRAHATLMRAPEAELRNFVQLTESQRSWEHRVRVETRDEGDFLYVLFLNESFGRYPVWGAGSYVVRRPLGETEPDQVKIFLRSDPGYYLRIFPHANRSRMDLHIADVATSRSIPVPLSFEQVLREPLHRIMELTGRTVDWPVLFPLGGTQNYAAVETMVRRARAALSDLPDAEDGAMDEHGNLVFIESLVLQDQEPGFNCSGFAKWIVDGIIKPVNGRYLSIEQLKRKHPDHRGHRWGLQHDALRDPYFGLDWTRNLALAAHSLHVHGTEVPDHTIDPRAADVNSVPFSRYTRDVGFPVSELGRIMYLLAVSEPGHFYLGSLSRPFGEEPVLRQHTHVAVLFPYIDRNGIFRVVVMERNVESSLVSLRRRYENEFIHLVRVRADERYEPPHIGRAGE
ncbi:MAG: hypothetical protein EA428_07495 [Spirochaetaceae bacterium]|nr:MAG: hypothetical protein EA428_07495 [Spirochaetaceae bacterium]